MEKSVHAFRRDKKLKFTQTEDKGQNVVKKNRGNRNVFSLEFEVGLESSEIGTSTVNSKR